MSDEVTFNDIPSFVAERALSVQREKQAAVDWNALLDQGKQMLQTPEAIGALGGAGLGGVMGGLSALNSDKKRKPILSSIGTGMLAGGAAGLGGGAMYNLFTNPDSPYRQGLNPDIESKIEEYYKAKSPPPYENLANAASKATNVANETVGAGTRILNQATNPVMVGAVGTDIGTSLARNSMRGSGIGRDTLPISISAFQRGAQAIKDVPGVGDIKDISTALSALDDKSIQDVLTSAATRGSAVIPNTNITLTKSQVKDIVSAGGGQPGLLQMIAKGRSGNELAGTGYGKPKYPSMGSAEQFEESLRDPIKKTPTWKGFAQRQLAENPLHTKQRRIGARVGGYGLLGLLLDYLARGSGANQKMEDLGRQISEAAQ